MKCRSNPFESDSDLDNKKWDKILCPVPIFMTALEDSNFYPLS